MANVVAREAAAVGINQIFAPVSDLARELRYGRVGDYLKFEQLSFVLT